MHDTYLLSLPVELRSMIYDFCFPPQETRVQLVPYRKNSPACKRNIPTCLYLICRRIHAELPSLSSKVQSLDLLYIIQGAHLGNYVVPGFGSKQDDDPRQERFRNVMRYAHRIRLVGYGKIEWKGRAIQSPSMYLRAGPECALRVLEVQPILWGKALVARRIMDNMTSLTTHPEVAGGLVFRLIRDSEGQGDNTGLDDIEKWLESYQRLTPESRDKARKRKSWNVCDSTRQIGAE